MGYSYHGGIHGGGIDHCEGQPRGHYPFAKCPAGLWSWVTVYIASAAVALVAFSLTALLWFLYMLCKRRYRDISSLSRHDVCTQVRNAVLYAFGMPILTPMLIPIIPVLMVLLAIRQWLLRRGARVPSFLLPPNRHRFCLVPRNPDAGDVEMAATVDLPWRRRGWLVVLRSREREPVGLTDREARLRRFMTRLRKTSERPSVVLGREDTTVVSALCPPTITARLRRLVVEVIKLEQEDLFRQIVGWL